MDEARRHAEQALALRGVLGGAGGNALYELGVVQRQTGAMQQARATYERALAIYRELGDGNAEAKVLNSLAILHAEQGRFDEARAHFEECALDQPRAGRSPPGRSRARQPRQPELGQGRLESDASNPRPRSRSIATPESGSRRARHWPASPCSTRRAVMSRLRAAISSQRWRSRAIPATAAMEGVVLGRLGAPGKRKRAARGGAPALRPGARHPSRRRQPSLRRRGARAARRSAGAAGSRRRSARPAGRRRGAPARRRRKARAGELAVPARAARARRRRAGARLAIARGGEQRCRSAGASTRPRSCGRRSRRCARRSTTSRPDAVYDSAEKFRTMMWNRPRV